MQYNNSNRMIPLFENYCRQNQIDGKMITADIDGRSLKLKVASTPDSMMQGYSNSDEPREGEGMIFIYPESAPLYFWMKGVDFPLDIIFFDSAMNMVEYLTMEPCGSAREEDLPRYQSSKPARFAVEVPANWCESNKISKNCRLKF
jgi:uncharacterized membrane protein (UPF0127 family)